MLPAPATALRRALLLTIFPGALVSAGDVAEAPHTPGAASAAGRTSIPPARRIEIPSREDGGPSSHRSGLTADDLVRVRDVSGFSLSPDGRRVAYALRRADPERNAYDIEWFVVPTVENAEPLPIADGGEAILHVFPNGQRNGELAATPARWSPDGEWIAFARKEDDETQLWRARADGRGAEQLTHNAADVEDFEWSDDGARIFFSVGRDRGFTDAAEEKDGRDGFLVGDPMPPIAGRGWPRWPECVAQRRNSPMAADEGRSCERRLWVVDLDAGIERVASEGELTEHRDMAGSVRTDAEARVERMLDGTGQTYGVLSPNGRRVAFFENPDPQKYTGSPPPKRLAVANADTLENRRACLAGACTGFRMREIWWSTDSREVFVLSNDGPGQATQSLYRWRPGDPDVSALFRSDEFRVRDCVRTGGRLICIREGWTTPDHIASISLHDGFVEVIVDPNPELQRFSFTKVEKLLYDDGKGVDTYGHLVYPADYEAGERYPVVVVQYRTGGFLRGGTGDEQPIHVYAQQGMFVLSTNMPINDVLYATQGGDELETSALLWEDERNNRRGLSAILKALDELERRRLIDPARVGVTGLSSGASIVEQALVYTDRFAAASAAYANASPFAYYWMQSEIVRRTLYRDLHPFSEAGLAMWRERSSGLNPGKISEPYLLQVADREYLLTLQNYVDLKDAGKPVALFIFPEEYHIKWQPAHRLAVYKRNIDWMNFWLRGVESDLSNSQNQYERWRSMRENQCRLFGPSGAERAPNKAAPWYCRRGAR